ncbi:tRNA:m(4)X modification enzyme TRM13 homolog isoform X1 [Callorhinchus milii]|uniref:tRNA:m(4)X modification enzyme TRM13 n=1 Tax=Callorhinchus milii TaxID=7868 RepID=A0A4W3GH89_CALMI|nr:tRNA:m(4)X modification enzyme TRM13 homolog isoform X1 [Callorhinchus milii]
MAGEAAADGVRAPLSGRCSYFVVKKRRYCRMVTARGHRLCGEHRTESENQGKRIRCPLDPKHTVDEDKLEKHLKKCNSREKPKPVYYRHNVNGGPEDAEENSKQQVPLCDLSKEEIEIMITKLRKATSEYLLLSAGLNSTITDRTLTHTALREALDDPKNGDSASKHLKQQASLVGNLERLGLLGSNRCFVEFGAGRGKLSHWVARALQGVPNVHFLLVERASTRFKVDGKHQNQGSMFGRLQIDIQHLSLDKVPLLTSETLPVVGIGKHLCGAATDLSLRCLVERYRVKEDNDTEPATKRLKADPTETQQQQRDPDKEVNSSPTLGIAVALCCHHKCEWKHYVGKEFFSSQGLDREDFQIFQRMSSWATCEKSCSLSRAASAEPPQEHGWGESSQCAAEVLEMLTVRERESLGLLCKRLIDHGRIEYLQQRGFMATLQYYTSPCISPENVLLTAVPPQSKENF